MLRECAGVLGAADLERCERDVEQEAGEIVGDQRQQTDRSVAAMRAVLNEPRRPRRAEVGDPRLRGPGARGARRRARRPGDGGRRRPRVARRAAARRADVRRLAGAAADHRPRRPAAVRRRARDARRHGPRHAARVVASGEFAFRRIEMALSGYYLLGVEPAPSDRDGKRHRSRSRRRDAASRVQSRRGFLSPDGPAAATPIEALTRTLQGACAGHRPADADVDVDLQGAGHRRGSACSSPPRVERGTTESLSYAAGLVVATKEGKVIAANAEPRELPPLEGDEGWRSTPAASPSIPGEYRLRAGRRQRGQAKSGSVERAVTAWQMNGDALALGDLLLAAEPDRCGDVAGAQRRAARAQRLAGGAGRGLRAGVGSGSRGDGAARGPEGGVGAAAGGRAAAGARRQFAGGARRAGARRRRGDSARAATWRG